MPTALGRALDHIFGDSARQSRARARGRRQPSARARANEIIEMDVPQSVAQFGHRGIARKDDDFIPAYVLNYIIGGGGFSSRLMEEVREKRGLAYSVHSNLFPFQHGAVFIGNVATKNEAVGQSLEVIEERAAAARRAGPDRRGARQAPKAISPALTRSASNPRRASPTSCCGSRSRISASITSISAMS